MMNTEKEIRFFPIIKNEGGEFVHALPVKRMYGFKSKHSLKVYVNLLAIEKVQSYHIATRLV